MGSSIAFVDPMKSGANIFRPGQQHIPFWKVCEWGERFFSDRDGASYPHLATSLVLTVISKLSVLEGSTRELCSHVKEFAGTAGGACAISGTYYQFCALGKALSMPIDPENTECPKTSEEKVARVFKEVALTVEMGAEGLGCVLGWVASNSIALVGTIAKVSCCGAVATLIARSHDLYTLQGDTVKGLQSPYEEVQHFALVKIAKAINSMTLALFVLMRTCYPVFMPLIGSSTFVALGLSISWLTLEVGSFFYDKYLGEQGFFKIAEA